VCVCVCVETKIEKVRKAVQQVVQGGMFPRIKNMYRGEERVASAQRTVEAARGFTARLDVPASWESRNKGGCRWRRGVCVCVCACVCVLDGTYDRQNCCRWEAPR
jgi:hypothetical protein